VGNGRRLVLLALIAALCCLGVPLLFAEVSQSLRQALSEVGSPSFMIALAIALLAVFGMLLAVQGVLVRGLTYRIPAVVIILGVVVGSVYLAWFVPFGTYFYGTQVALAASVYAGFSAMALLIMPRAVKETQSSGAQRVA